MASAKGSSNIAGNIKDGCPKIFHDSVHGSIKLDPLLLNIIDTPQYQRLRDIKQLGVSYWVFPGACHNRFEHGIGTSHLCGMMLSTLRDLHKNEYKDGIAGLITDNDILCIKIAGLCHDLGHGPFSHFFQGYMERKEPKSKWKHEEQSCKLFDEILQENNGLQSELKVRGIDPALIKKMIMGKYPEEAKDCLPAEVCEYGHNDTERKTMVKKFLYEIVANKDTGIDCDKFDYFARDTHHLGMNNSFNFLRFFQNVRIMPDQDKLQVFVRDKEIYNLYELFHVRWMLHRRVYQHKTSKVIEEIMYQALSKVDQRFQISETAKEGAPRYTFLTDSLFYEILKTQEEDEDLKEAQKLLNQLQNRQLYHFCGEKQCNPPENEDIATEIVRMAGDGMLTTEDLFVNTTYISFGKGAENPMKICKYFDKDGMVKELPHDELSDILPKKFEEHYVRIYCKSIEKMEVAKSAFTSWCKEMTGTKTK